MVVFSSCTRRGIKARYNYMRTLAKVNANKLFILDDFAADHRGSYYLGYDQTYSEEKATIGLINHIKKNLGTDKLICCGSSKGGDSSIDFGLQYEDSYKQKIYMHFSDKEHTYTEHIKDLLGCFNENGYNVECDIADYTNHSDISYYFPDYLINTLKQIL